MLLLCGHQRYLFSVPLIAPYTPHGKPEVGLNGTLSRDTAIQQEKEEEEAKEDRIVSKTSGHLADYWDLWRVKEIKHLTYE